MVVWRRDLDHVHPDDGQLQGDPAYGVGDSRALSPPGSGVPVPGACPGSHTSMVDRKENAVAVVRDAERLGEALPEAAVHDLGHRVIPGRSTQLSGGGQ